MDELPELIDDDEDDGWMTYITRRAGTWTQRKKQKEIPCRWGVH